MRNIVLANGTVHVLLSQKNYKTTILEGYRQEKRDKLNSGYRQEKRDKLNSAGEIETTT
jgi:hypothetical protein